jgi:hypothetical protein
MSRKYTDDEFFDVIPTRHPSRAGRDIEREIASLADGYSGTRKIVRPLDSGGEIMLNTRLGNPEFIITEPEPAPIEEEEVTPVNVICIPSHFTNAHDGWGFRFTMSGGHSVSGTANGETPENIFRKKNGAVEVMRYPEIEAEYNLNGDAPLYGTQGYWFESGTALSWNAYERDLYHRGVLIYQSAYGQRVLLCATAYRTKLFLIEADTNRERLYGLVGTLTRDEDGYIDSVSSVTDRWSTDAFFANRTVGTINHEDVALSAKGRAAFVDKAVGNFVIVEKDNDTGLYEIKESIATSVSFPDGLYGASMSADVTPTAQSSGPGPEGPGPISWTGWATKTYHEAKQTNRFVKIVWRKESLFALDEYHEWETTFSSRWETDYHKNAGEYYVIIDGARYNQSAYGYYTSAIRSIPIYPSGQPTTHFTKTNTISDSFDWEIGPGEASPTSPPPLVDTKNYFTICAMHPHKWVFLGTCQINEAENGAWSSTPRRYSFRVLSGAEKELISADLDDPEYVPTGIPDGPITSPPIFVSMGVGYYEPPTVFQMVDGAAFGQNGDFIFAPKFDRLNVPVYFDGTLANNFEDLVGTEVEYLNYIKLTPYPDDTPWRRWKFGVI